MNSPDSLSDEQEENLDRWFEAHCETYLEGIERFAEGDQGVSVVLEEPLDLEAFEEAVADTEGLNPTPVGEGISVMKHDELEDGLVHQYSIGVVFRAEEQEIPVGTNQIPFEPDGEIADRTVEDTLTVVAAYLEYQHS